MDVVVLVEGGDNDDRDRVCDPWACELAGGFEPVDTGHTNIHEADVWSVSVGEIDCIPPVFGFGDDGHAAGFEHDLDAGSDHGLVIGDEDSDLFLVCHRTASSGMLAETVQCSPSWPASNCPLNDSTRSRMPTMP